MTDPAPPVHYDHSTFLVARADEAQQIGPPPVPKHVALPGAKAAIAHDMLQAHQDNGRQQHEIVAWVNGRWARDNQHAIDAHNQWAAGPYAAAIQAMREADMQAQAEKLRRQALWEQIISERDARNA